MKQTKKELIFNKPKVRPVILAMAIASCLAHSTVTSAATTPPVAELAATQQTPIEESAARLAAAIQARDNAKIVRDNAAVALRAINKSQDIEEWRLANTAYKKARKQYRIAKNNYKKAVKQHKKLLEQIGSGGGQTQQPLQNRVI